MTFDEINNIGSSPLAELFEGKIQSIGFENNILEINGKIAIPVTDISPVYDCSSDIELIDESGTFLGVLCFMRDKTEYSINTLTDWQLVAFLSATTLECIATNAYNFDVDYLVLEQDKFDEYMTKYHKTAPLWGMFSHEGALPLAHKQAQGSITAVAGLNFPTDYHTENCLRAIKEPYAFERFLKQYHLLELVLDLEIVQEIKSLGDDLMGIGKILNEYKRGDVERLKSVVQPKCQHISKIAKLLNEIEHHLAKAKLVFFDFGKESNTFNDFEQLSGLMSETDGFLLSENIKKHKRNFNTNDYNNFILNTSIYWIYRIRCSIAHNKIGEYVMTKDDEVFVAEFGEPLLKEIIIQVFKN